MLNQGVLWSTLVYEISNYVCSYITYTKESCFGLETSPFYSHKLYSLCDIFQATMCHMFIDTGFVYHIHIQSYNRSIHLKMVHRMGLSSSKTISWFVINTFSRKWSRWLSFFAQKTPSKERHRIAYQLYQFKEYRFVLHLSCKCPKRWPGLGSYCFILACFRVW